MMVLQVLLFTNAEGYEYSVCNISNIDVLQARDSCNSRTVLENVSFHCINLRINC